MYIGGFSFHFTSSHPPGEREITMGYKPQFGHDREKDGIANALTNVTGKNRKLLTLYLQNAALRYANGKSKSRTVIVEKDTFPLAATRPTGGWWFSGADNMEYCVQTLSLRSADGRFDLPGAPSRSNCDWKPWTISTYGNWWKRVDHKYQISQRFGDSRGKPSPVPGRR
jgi:hypothetical protein